jgi:hypothetical protein
MTNSFTSIVGDGQEIAANGLAVMNTVFEFTEPVYPATNEVVAYTATAAGICVPAEVANPITVANPEAPAVTSELLPDCHIAALLRFWVLSSL